MPTPNPEEALPLASQPPTSTQETEPDQPAQPFRRRYLILAGVVFVLLVTAAGAYLGYQEAVRQRLAEQTTAVALQAATQFQYGLQDMEAGKLDQARQRFEYVIQLDPNFPQAREKLAQAILEASYTATPTTAPPTETPTVAPTEDLRPAEQLFTQAKQDLADKDWAKALQTLDSLRNANLNYRAIDVDGMYYVALRNRGADQILKEGHLQEGLYNLALAERFGPLDGEARGYRSWAELYLTGAAYWKVNWPQVMNYFSQIIPYFPNLRDASGLTAGERYRQAAAGYGDQLDAAGDNCEAEKNYRLSLDWGGDPKVEEAYNKAAEACAASKASPTPEFTATPDPALVSPTAPTEGGQPPAETQPAPAPTETPTPPPAENPTPASG